MGYSTEFKGRFWILPRLKPAHARYLAAFSRTGRLKRDPARCAHIPDPFRIAVDLPLGPEGDFFTGGYRILDVGETHCSRTAFGALDDITPPGMTLLNERCKMGHEKGWAKRRDEIDAGCQPSFRCHWCPVGYENFNFTKGFNPAKIATEKPGDSLVWDGMEKFDEYIHWLRYLLKNFFTPWGYLLDGVVNWQGERPDDQGDIILEIKDSKTVMTINDCSKPKLLPVDRLRVLPF